MNQKRVYFVSGIDTDAGKSYATGYLARLWCDRGERVVTQKLVQTGCRADEISEDILLHRRIMGVEILPEDRDFSTCPLHFTYPASPDLASRIDGLAVDLAIADCSTAQLLEKYDTLLVEGAGGLMVPITGHYTMADYVVERSMPLILVTNPKLGSLNHTLLSLELCRNRGIELCMVAYNCCPATSPEITDDTREYIKKYVAEFFPDCKFVEIPYISI